MKTVLVTFGLALAFAALAHAIPMPMSEPGSDLEMAPRYYSPEELPAPNEKLRDLLEALEYEAALEAAEENAARGAMASPRMSVAPEGAVVNGESGPDEKRGFFSGHSVDKRRRRRYGFWVTAINKMDRGHLRGFLGAHKNVYNVYKRSV